MEVYCIDKRSLNLALKREHYQLPVLGDIQSSQTSPDQKSSVKWTSAMVTGTASGKKILADSPPFLPHLDDTDGHAFPLDSL